MHNYPISGKNLLLILFGSSLVAATASCRPEPSETEVWEPVPAKVDPAFVSKTPPSDAIVLFDGSSLEEWCAPDGSPTEWIVGEDDFMEQRGGHDLVSQRSFGDVHLYLEWMVPADVSGSGQRRGNSGVFLQGRYELQVLDNWENPTYVNGMAGSLYKQHIPLANPARQPGEWQSYEIFFKAPIFDGEGELKRPARVTALLNGILVLNNVEVLGSTTWRGRPRYEPHGHDRITIQKHGSTSGMRFRNIWVRELNEYIPMTDGIIGGKRQL